ncbi:unnamed protein product [Blepharisma stoltei]|uniref:Class I SAM-dependent methyltransferase n=1 Tax=Blepharisma stoltei TaxID=1481888 RepID=A0AAU9J2U9_9CILI|nr:unnamed protein product [Blepharisma stoltei]
MSRLIDNFIIMVSSSVLLLQMVLCLSAYAITTENYVLSDSPNPDFEKFGEYSNAILRSSIFLALSGRISKEDKRYPTLTEVLKLMVDRNSYTLIEAGTAREGEGSCAGDGCSTPIFAHFSYLTGRNFISVDISEKNCEKSRQAIRPYADNSKVIKSDSIAFLKEFRDPIDFLYLDSVDYDFKNPKVSQEHSLKEIKAAYGKLHEHSIILLDDCTLPGGGKCKLAAEFLLKNGWEKLIDSYQMVFIHTESIIW